MKDARERYEHYLNRKTVIRKTDKLDLEVLNKLEIEKYTLIRDIIQDALNNKTNLSEDDWQSLMIPFITLLFQNISRSSRRLKFSTITLILRLKQIGL